MITVLPTIPKLIVDERTADAFRGGATGTCRGGPRAVAGLQTAGAVGAGPGWTGPAHAGVTPLDPLGASPGALIPQ